MDKTKSTCKLCFERAANQKNSHIIPKFLGERLFVETKPRHSLLFTSDGKLRKVQDTPKEDNIICQECEKGFNVYETYCALRLKRYNDLSYRNSKYFGNLKIGTIDCYYSKDLDIKIFNLFIYSIVWRASACESDVFENFKLLSEDEEELRSILKKYSSLNLSELDSKLKFCKELPSHYHFVMQAEKKLKTPNSGLYLKTINENFHHLGLVDYSLFYFTDKKEISPGFEAFNNNRLEGNVMVALLPENIWRDTNLNIMQALLKRP